jgi:uncharacterized protein
MTGKRKIGFALLDRSKVQEMGRKGAKAVHEAGTAYKFTSEKAREAGRRGGMAVRTKRPVANDSAEPSGGGQASEEESTDGTFEGRSEE